MQHGHLRFVFEAGRRPVLLDLDGSPVGADARLDDLVLSWEPWRFRDDRFSFVKALGDDFDLCLRVYAGAQRYLEDILEGHEWLSYRLRLPGGATVDGRDVLDAARAAGLAWGEVRDGRVVLYGERLHADTTLHVRIPMLLRHAGTFATGGAVAYLTERWGTFNVALRAPDGSLTQLTQDQATQEALLRLGGPREQFSQQLLASRARPGATRLGQLREGRVHCP